MSEPFYSIAYAAAEASSTAQILTVAWPYIFISIVIVLGLIGTALKVLRNQND